MTTYCKFGNFREHFIFANSVKRRINDVLTTSVNDRVVLPFRVDLFSRNFAYAKIRENKTFAIFFEFTVVKHYLHKANIVIRFV